MTRSVYRLYRLKPRLCEECGEERPIVFRGVKLVERSDSADRLGWSGRVDGNQTLERRDLCSKCGQVWANEHNAEVVE